MEIKDPDITNIRSFFNLKKILTKTSILIHLDHNRAHYIDINVSHKFEIKIIFNNYQASKVTQYQKAQTKLETSSLLLAKNDLLCS